jgi:hypothetical protein
LDIFIYLCWQDYYFRLTLDIIGLIAFGKDLGSLSGQNGDFMAAFDFCQQVMMIMMMIHDDHDEMIWW